jgi:hypothetical protein
MVLDDVQNKPTIQLNLFATHAFVMAPIEYTSEPNLEHPMQSVKMLKGHSDEKEKEN